MENLPLLLNTSITLIVGFVAYRVYYVQKRDNKRDAANIIVLELKNAERNLEEVRKLYEAERAANSQAMIFPEKVRLMTTESWTKYKYLFARDLSPEQWDEVGRFYENCKLFDEAVELKEASFKFNATEIRANVFRIVGDYAKELADNLKPNPEGNPQIDKSNRQITEDIKDRKSFAVASMLGRGELFETYSPDKPYHDAAYYYNLLPKSVINTPTGQRLIGLSLRKKWLRRRTR